MNKIFKVIWNPATGSYSVASETAKSRGKKSGRSKLLISALVAGGMLSSFGALATGNEPGTPVGTGSGWVAIGQDSQANAFTDGNGASTAVGYKAFAEGTWSSAIGAMTHAIGPASMAFGVNAVSTGQRSIAMGASSSSVGQFSMALGRYANSGGDYSIAQGDKSNAAGLNAIAVGRSSSAAGEKAIALGNAAKATEIMSIALGDTANASKAYSMALGASSVASEENAIALGRSSVASGTDSLAFGRQSLASAANAIAMGAETEAAENATAIGNNAKAKGTNSMAIGFGSLADKVNTIALGNGSQALADNAIAIGQGNKADGVDAIALGNGSQSRGLNTIALGTASNATGDKSLALGSNSSANGINSVALGADSIADLDNTVSVGNSSLKRKIVNVKNGAIKSDSYDAINGSQLYAISDSVAKRLGGGSAVDVDDGTVTAPTYNLKNGSKNNVGAALAVLDENTLQWDQTKGKYSAAHGTSSPTASVITDVADGTISASSKDAVNGSQLKATNDDVEANTANIATNTSNIATNTASIATNTTNITNLTDSVGDLKDDALLWNDAKNAFSAAHDKDTTSKITNVKDADLTADSTDAVNGSQLKTTNDAVATNTTNIANNTSNIATNTTNISNLTETVTNLGEDALKWDKDNGVFTAAHGTEATSKITNVKDADLTADSTDAVNGSQLKTTNDAVATNTTNIANNTSNISNLTETVTNLGEDALKWDKDNGVFTAAHGNNAASKITNILDGAVTATSSDAINGSQLYDLSSNIATYFGGNASVNTDGVFTGPTYKIGETNYYNVGDALAAINSSFSTSLGDALLWDASVDKFSAKHGTNGDASVITDVANGDVSSTSSDAVNGSQLYTTNKYVVDALGGNAEINADGSITAPTYTIANADYDNVGDALNAIDTTLDDALLWDADAGENGAFSAAHGKDKTASVITNVANGAISATSSDAVNGSQLYTTNQYIVDALGGDAEVNADGTITAPTYTIANTDYNNVGDALDALDDNALLWDETANGGAGAYNASHDGKASIITNVANGSISEDSTDAVNGSQLNATNMMIEQNSQIINQLAGNTDATYIEENGAGINYVRTNDNGLAFNDASASGVGATAVGYNAVASGASSVAIGQNSSSTVDTGIALGSSSVSSRVIAKGSRDTSVTENGVVIGYDTTDGELLGALSIGDDGKYRQIINVADGSEAHDAVTVRQLQNAIGAVATTPTKYFHANSTAEDSLAVGEDSLAMGAKTVVNGNAGIGIGLNTLVLADAINGIAIGSNARANHANSIAMGNGSQTTRGAQTGYTAYNMDAPQNSVGEFSVGSEDGQRQITNVAAGSADTDAVNVGQLKVTDERVAQNTQSITNLNNQVTNLDTRVTNIENGIGDIVTTGSTKYFKTNTDGVDANAQGKDSVAIGSGSIAAADNSVALGTGSVANEENTISVGSSTNQRRITNVAAGVNATDAVNVSQLKSSEAGGVRYDTKADGSIDYSNITLGGGNGGTTRISNVSAGVNNNDAVNYAQLKQSVQETKQYTDQRMVEMDNKLSKTESKLSGGIASAMAMTGLPQAYTPGASMASIGGGTYNGESAVALGVSMVSANGRWVYKLQGSTNSQGEYSAALGAGIQW
ncbi:YadA-like family protein [Escherichia coli]|uniref:YadA-like family protein n=1 Tax=Escherichia coli TaxID=562 RepID=UPI0005F941BD|nr:YadA-like family protein [Escherichia coli]EFD0322237.1 adhesin [Escherichia coli]EFE5195355.1 adhesin [Escherichia coli]EFF1326997.1 adhesin [Escherichia coli]EGA7838102.1 adhesin [Escherichia coli]EGF8484357.1 adhesin [Escherichia coli]